MHLRAASSLCSQPRLLVAKSVCVSLSPIPTAPPSPSASHRLLQPSFSSNNHSSRLMSATGHTTITTAANADNQQPSTATPSDQQPQQTPLVQYVVLRRDLWSALKWPLGSIVAQACHAATAALHAGVVSGDAATATYCSEANIDSMHKVVLEIKDEKQLRDLSAKLSTAGIQHKLWVEQPEDYATSLATKPYPKADIAQHFKKLQLCKASFS